MWGGLDTHGECGARTNNGFWEEPISRSRRSEAKPPPPEVKNISAFGVQRKQKIRLVLRILQIGELNSKSDRPPSLPP